MRLFHFSDSPGIRRFVPRSPLIPSARPNGREWLDAPLVWAVDEWHEFMYFFPRDCPRILIWPTAQTSRQDKETWFGGQSSRAIAFAEASWSTRISAGVVHRYEMPLPLFQNIDDAGMWVSTQPVVPETAERIGDLPSQLGSRNIALRIVERLTPLRNIWQTSLHVSGIRLRNAEDWAR